MYKLLFPAGVWVFSVCLSGTRGLGGLPAVPLRAGDYLCSALDSEFAVVVGFGHLLVHELLHIALRRMFVQNRLAYNVWIIRD